MTASVTHLPTIRHSSGLLKRASEVLDGWKVPTAQQPLVLGMGGMKQREYIKILKGLRALDSETVSESSGLVIAIDDATQKMFPFSEDSARLWVGTPHRSLGGKSPLDLIRMNGLEGLRSVERLINGKCLLSAS